MTPRPHPRTTNCTPAQARDRLQAARAYLDLAALGASDADPTPHQRAATVGNAVLAGIAASDAICGLALRRYSRGQDHAQAADLLATVKLRDPTLAARFTRLLALKNASHYSAGSVTAQDVERALRTAGDLIAEAEAWSGR